MARPKPANGSVVSRVGTTSLWEQIVIDLQNEISSGLLEPGHRLPSETQLCKRFGVSRVTVRQALVTLEQQGLIFSQAGKGWFVESSLHEVPGQVQSFTEMARSRGLTPDSIVLTRELRAASLDEADSLRIAPGSEVMSLRRVRRLDGHCVAIDHSVVPAQMLGDVSDIDFANASLHDAFRRNGVAPFRADYEMLAVAADEEQSSLLEVQVGFPLLTARQIFYDAQDRRMEQGTISYRSDRYSFRAVLHV